MWIPRRDEKVWYLGGNLTGQPLRYADSMKNKSASPL